LQCEKCARAKITWVNMVSLKFCDCGLIVSWEYFACVFSKVNYDFDARAIFVCRLKEVCAVKPG
jgi:hypothetical protein